MNNRDEKMTFTGAGLNDSSFLGAINKANNSPSKRTVPAGATWPFVKLSINKKTIEFRMAHIHKSVSSDVRITLSKLGYLYFHSVDHANDFGFCTLRVDALIRKLNEHGYRLDESCRRNLLAAKIFMYSMFCVQMIIVAIVIIMTILKPNGV
jgi:hypothetical protein